MHSAISEKLGLKRIIKGKISEKKKVFYQTLTQGERKKLRIDFRKNYTTKKKKVDLCIIDKNCAVISSELAFNFVILSALQSRQLNLDFALEEREEQKRAISKQKQLLHEEWGKQGKQNKILIDDLKQRDDLYCKYFMAEGQNQEFFKQSDETEKNSLILADISLNISQIGEHTSVIQKSLFLTFLSKVLQTLTFLKTDHLCSIKIYGSHKLPTIYEPILAQVVLNSLQLALKPQNHKLVKLDIPVIISEIYDGLKLRLQQCCVEEDQGDSRDNPFYRISTLRIGQPQQNITNVQIKAIIANFLSLFPRLVSLRLDLYLQENSFEILSDQISRTNPLLEQLTVSQISQSNDKILGLKNLLSKSPYLFQLVIPYNKENVEKNKQEKQLVNLIIMKFYYLQRCLSAMKILKHQNYSFNTSCNILERYGTIRSLF